MLLAAIERRYRITYKTHPDELKENHPGPILKVGQASAARQPDGKEQPRAHAPEAIAGSLDMLSDLIKREALETTAPPKVKFWPDHQTYFKN